MSAGSVCRMGSRDEVLKLQRGTIALVRKLEAATVSANTVREVFTGTTNDIRNKLKDQCLTVISNVNDTTDLARKAEDVVWRKVYHDVMQAFKRLKKEASREDVALLQCHFLSGIGFYSNILNTITTQENVSIAFLDLYSMASASQNGLVAKKPLHERVHRILINIGDLYRYLEELGHVGSRAAATKWYNAALVWNPSIGMPFNQLGTLFGLSNYGHDCAYYYMRCLFSETPFEGAENNLKRVLVANAKNYKMNDGNSTESTAVVKRCLTLLSSLALEYWVPSDVPIAKKVEEYICIFKEALELPVKITTSSKPTYLQNITIFRKAVMIIMFFDRQQRKKIDGNMLSATTALALNFFFVVVASCNKKLDNRVRSNVSLNGNDEISVHGRERNENSPNRAQSKLRRKKLAFNYDLDVDMNFDDDDDSEFSEIEETVLSTLDVLDISLSDLSDGDCESGNDRYDSSGEDDKLVKSVIPDSVSTTSDASLKDLDDTLRFLYFDMPIPTIKILCDWLSMNYQLLGFCMDSFGNVFQELVQLLNNLLQIEDEMLISNPQFVELKHSGKNWIQPFPLSCDWTIYKFAALEPVHSKNIDFANHPLSEMEMAFCAIESLISFGHFLDKQCSSFRYDATARSFKIEEARNEIVHSSSFNFKLPLSPEYKDSLSTGSCKPVKNGSDNEQLLGDIENKNNAVSNRKKNDAMKFTVEFLKSEVYQLEKAVNGKVVQMPAYIVVDSSAFCEHLNLVKELIGSRSFVLVVPRIVLADLDQAKKTSAPAREAIRWLESEAQKGSRSLKFQKENEKLALEHLKYPSRKDKDKDALGFYLLLENCNYLNQQNTSIRSEFEMVTLLTGQSNRFPSNGKIVASNTGINLERIDEFVTKWRTSTKSKT